MIAGILDPDAGSCQVFERDWQQMSPHVKTRYRGQHIGFVFQAFNLLPTLTAAENVAVPLLINGGARREAIRRAREVLARVGLGERAVRHRPSCQVASNSVWRSRAPWCMTPN